MFRVAGVERATWFEDGFLGPMHGLPCVLLTRSCSPSGSGVPWKTSVSEMEVRVQVSSV